MTLKEAVKVCLGKKYADFSTRASRKECGFFFLFYFILCMVLFMINIMVGVMFEDSIEGIMSAKTNNATVVALENKFIYEDETLVKKISDYFFRDWESIIQILRR